MSMAVKLVEELLTLNIDRGCSDSDMDLVLIPFPHPPLTFRQTKSQNRNTEGFTLPAFRTIRPEQHWPDSSPPFEQAPHVGIDPQIGDQLATKLGLLSGEIFAR